LYWRALLLFESRCLREVGPKKRIAGAGIAMPDKLHEFLRECLISRRASESLLRHRGIRFRRPGSVATPRDNAIKLRRRMWLRSLLDGFIGGPEDNWIVLVAHGWNPSRGELWTITLQWRKSCTP